MTEVLPTFGPVEPDDGLLLTAVTVLDRRTLLEMTAEARRLLWLDVHGGTRARLVASVARFYMAHADITIHSEPPYCALLWEGDETAVGYVLSARAYKHKDLSHRLREREDYRDGEWIRLTTRCGCESRTMRYPAPLPLFIRKTTNDGGTRNFRRGPPNDFGATVYKEV